MGIEATASRQGTKTLDALSHETPPLPFASIPILASEGMYKMRRDGVANQPLARLKWKQ